MLVSAGSEGLHGRGHHGDAQASPVHKMQKAPPQLGLKRRLSSGGCGVLRHANAGASSFGANTTSPQTHPSPQEPQGSTGTGATGGRLESAYERRNSNTSRSIEQETAPLSSCPCPVSWPPPPRSVALFLAGVPGAQTRLMSIDEVKPGMVGTGRTVFSGTTLEDFKVHVLGVLHNVIAPNRDLILARLEGGPLAKTGVIAGMSGSPVYVDGRLMGAVSYALGQFATEPIAGITPIAEMTDATTMSASRGRHAAGGAQLAVPARRALRDLDARPRPVPPGGVPAVTRADVASPGAMLRPIAVPLSASGFEPDVLAALVAYLRRGRPAAGDRPGAAASAHRSEPTDAGTRRRGRRVAALRRLRARRDRHGDARGRGPRLRVRPSALQPRADRVSDDGGDRARRASEPDDVEQDCQLRSGDRHAAAGPRHRHCRQARGRARAHPHDRDAQFRPPRRADVLVRRGARSHLHAAARLSRRGQRADRLRARRRSGVDHRPGHGEHPLPRRPRLRGRVHRRPADRPRPPPTWPDRSRSCSGTPRSPWRSSALRSPSMPPRKPGRRGSSGCGSIPRGRRPVGRPRSRSRFAAPRATRS